MAIRDKGKGRAQLVVDVYVNGERKRKTKMVSYKGKKELKDLYDDFEKECLAAPLCADTVEQLLDDYTASLKVRGVRATTLQGYKSNKKRIIEKIGSIKAKELTPYQVEQLINYMVLKCNNSPKTVKNTISFLSSAYKYGIQNRILADNPCVNVRLPKKKKREAVILDDQQLKVFLAALDREPLDIKVFFELALYCGLRRSEILGLTEADINFNFGTVNIEKTRHRVDGADVTQPPKTDQSWRIVSAPKFLLQDMKTLIQEHHDAPYETDEYLIQRFGKKIEPDYPKTVIRRITLENDLPPVTTHGLRHTFASMLNASGEFDIAEISAALGHSTISTTLNIYTHIFKGGKPSRMRIAEYYDKQNGAKMAHEESDEAVSGQ